MAETPKLLSKHPNPGGPLTGLFGESIESVRKKQRFRWAFPAKLSYRRRAQPCPQCGKRPWRLEWLYYRSPKWTWETLCGRAGWITVCNECQILVGFFPEVIS